MHIHFVNRSQNSCYWRRKVHDVALVEPVASVCHDMGHLYEQEVEHSDAQGLNFIQRVRLNVQDTNSPESAPNVRHLHEQQKRATLPEKKCLVCKTHFYWNRRSHMDRRSYMDKRRRIGEATVRCPSYLAKGKAICTCNLSRI